MAHTPKTPASPSAGRLAGRRALVTGGATGIGRSTAERLAADGASIVVNYVGDPSGPTEFAGELAAQGASAVAIEADVSSEPAVIELFDRSAQELGGPIDVLVNNAGIEKPFRVVDMALEEWNRVLAVNLTGAFLCAREAAKGLLAAGAPGVIVNVSSVHEIIPWPQFAHYCASKGGMKLFAQTLARELAADGIRVVNVAPGAILTPINQDLIEHPEKRAEVEAEIPLGRMGQPDEIAAAISWLASSEADYVTGSTLLVDGGMTLYPRFV